MTGAVREDLHAPGPGATGLCWALVAVLAVATLDEGGARPTGMLATHLAVLLALLAAVLPGAAPGARLAGTPLAAWNLFLLCALFGASLAPYTYGALLVTIELGVFTAVAWVAARSGGERFLAVCWLPLLAVAAGQGALALYQRLVLDAARPAGTFLNPNHLGAWLVTALLVAWGGTRTLHRGATRRASWILGGGAGLGLLLTGSRGALLGLGVGVAWLLARNWRGARPVQRRWMLATALLLAVAVGAVLVQRSRQADPFRYHRVRIWRACLVASSERPWTGVGPGQWPAAANSLNFALEQGPLRYERVLDSTHSDLLRLACEFGWPATLAALAALTLCAVEIRRRMSGEARDGIGAGAAAALLALAAQAAVDNLSERPGVYLLGAALLGALLSRRTAVPSGPGRRGAMAVGALLAFVWLVADLAPYRAWRLSVQPTAHRTGALDRALDLNPLQFDLWMRRAEGLVDEPGPLTLERYARSREAAEKSLRLQPADGRLQVRAARVEVRGLERFGDLASRERISSMYRRAERLARHDPFIPLEHAEFLLSFADPGGARRAAERTLAIEPRAVPPRLVLARVLLRQRPADAAGAARLLDEARMLAGRWSQHPVESEYARKLLRLDPGRERRVAAEVAAHGGANRR